MDDSSTVRRGMLVQLDTSLTRTSGLEFAINPTSLRRVLVAREGSRPHETVVFTLQLDATAASDGDVHPSAVGVHPQLAVLERMLRPATDGGTTLFAWGARAQPVAVAELTVDEVLFDPQLNPIRATVEVTLRVLDDDVANETAAEVTRANEAWHRKMAARSPTPRARFAPDR